MKSHEYADLFPMMATADIARLAEDIRENGQANPIVTFEGKILDGRNRYQACLLVDVDPGFAEYDGTEPLAFVVSHNLHRRHLNESQRGMVGAKLANLQHGANRHTLASAIALPNPPVTQKQAAEMLNIGVDSIKRSKTVLKSGIPELQDMQMSGEVSAKAASVVAKLPEEEQRKAVSGGVAGVKAAAKKPSSEQNSDSLESANSESTEQEQSSTRQQPLRIAHAMGIFYVAKNHMEKIAKNDIERIDALKAMIDYCNNRIESKK
jgi:ParB-like chromosome segregation protein Spo0J